MRSLILFGLIIFSFSAFSQSVISVTPARPADCQLQNYDRVNWVYEIQKISESEKSATFRFRTQYGACYYTRLEAAQLTPGWQAIGLMGQDALWPWQKDPVKTKLELVSSTELEVEVTFDKTKLFKKRDQEYFYMQFFPNGLASRMFFPWNVYVTATPTNGLKMAIQ